MGGSAGGQSQHLEPREAAVAIVRRLREQGFVAYLAGGCVRDELLGQDPKDYDIATDARPDDIRARFKRTAEVGAAFGVMLVREFGPTVEVATFRADGVYSDRRRPDSVEFSDAQRDAQRRDFTINALFIDPLAQGEDRVIDFVQGRADLATRTLRAVGEPDQRLAEDHLRALRAVRFAARFGLTIEPRTADAIRRHAADLDGVSRERIGEEVRRMLTHASRARAAELLDTLGLATAVFGEPRPFDGRVMAALPPDASYVCALTAMLVGRGVWSPGSPGPVAASLTAARRALLLSNDERDSLRDALESLRRMAVEWDTLGEAGRKRLASGPGSADALTLLRALDPVRSTVVEADVGHLATRHGGLRPPALVDGDALIALGFTPGPRFATILTAVYDAQLEGRVRDTAQAEALARSLAEAPA
jgi:poly(A) polymerase